MSDLGSAIQDEIDAIEALDTRRQTPPGQPGDEWDDEFEAFAAGVQTALNTAAPDSIRNPAGAITAPVDNQTTSTGELSVSDSQPVTAGPVGDGGEWIPLETFSVGGSTSFSTTSTTYERVTAYMDYPVVDYSAIRLTNINQLGRSLVGSTAQRGGVSDPVFVRLGNGDAEMSGIGPISSGIAPTAARDVDFSHLEMKVGGGEGEAFGLSLILWGQIT